MSFHFDSYSCTSIKCSDFGHQETINSLEMKANLVQSTEEEDLRPGEWEIQTGLGQFGC